MYPLLVWWNSLVVVVVAILLLVGLISDWCVVSVVPIVSPPQYPLLPCCWFQQPPVCLCHNKLNFLICLSKVLLCLLFLLRHMNLWHSSITSIPIQLPRLFIHVSICHLNMVIVLLIDLILSFISILSAFLTMYIPFGVLTVVLSFTLTGVRPLLRHLSVNLLWFWKSAIFISNFSHHLWNLTLSYPYSDINLVWMLLILFDFM